MNEYKIHKTRDYTVVCNSIFKNYNLSYKAKGLLTQMLSLPDNWDWSAKGLVAMSSDGRESVESGLRELETAGYLKRTQRRTAEGKLDGYIYDVYEKPFTGNPFTENPSTENQQQLSTIYNKVLNNNTPTTTCAKDVFFNWVKTSDLPMHYIPATFMRFGIPIDTDIDPYLHVFFDGSIADREMTERGERLFVLQHFERWLPKYIESKQKENDNARNQSAQRGREEPIQERPPVYPT